MLKSKKTAVAVAAGTMALGLLGGASPAQAAAKGEAAPAMKSWDTEARGVVVAHGGIVIRSDVSTSSEHKGVIDRSEIVWITCKAAGQDVHGNGIWYKLGSHNGYLAARYVKNVDGIPWC